MSDLSHNGSVGPRPSLQRAAAVLFWLLLWQLLAVVIAQPILLVGPWETVVALVRLGGQGAFWAVVARSFLTIAGGFLGAFALGSGLGLLAGRWPWLGVLLRPPMMVLKSTPVACIIVLLLLWVGAQGVPVAAVFLVAVPAYYFSMAEALETSPARTGEVLRAMGTTHAVRFLAVGWTHACPYLLATSRSACAMAWKAGVAAELIGLALGTLGERIYQAKLLLATDDLLAWTVVVVALASLFEHLFCAVVEKSAGPASRAAVALATRRGRPSVEPRALSVEGACVAYGGGPAVLDDLDLTVGPGTRLVVMGPSGRGKTTLVRTAAGFLRPREGAVALVRPLSVMLQEPTLVETLDAVANVVVATGCDGTSTRWLLRELVGEEALDRPVAELSGGQRRRVEVVRAMVCPSAAVVLDEPFTGLDGATRERTRRFILAHLGGRPLMVTSHDPSDATGLDADLLGL